ncbi:MAG: hypothetical protein ACRD1E_03010 [Terriglobales bacterium]
MAAQVHGKQDTVNSFDSESHPVTFEGNPVVYDALGRAVESGTGSNGGEFLYGPGGGKLAVMVGQTLARADIPLPGGGEAVYMAGAGLAAVGVAAVNASIFITSGAMFAAAYAAPVAGCADPLPIEPLTCAASIAAGAMYGAIGAGTLAGGVWFFKNVTVPAFRNWGGQ